jgi:phosphoserine phosphatase RsbU/P
MTIGSGERGRHREQFVADPSEHRETTVISRAVAAPQSPEQPEHVLMVRAGTAPPQLVPLQALPLTIGRSAPSQLILDDSTISRHHCRLDRHDDSIILTDLDSTNGTFINGERVHGPVVLEDGARITIGDHSLSYHRRLRALFLENSPQDAALADQALQDAGILLQTRRVTSRDDFIAALDAFHPQLILAANDVPQLDGLTATALVRQRNAELPIIVVADPLDNELAAEAIKAGANDYIRKDRLARLPLAVRHARAAAETLRERRRTAQALQRSASEIADLYNHAPCGYHSINSDQIIVSINDTELAWLGYRRDEVVGKMRLADLLTPDSAESFQQAFARLLATGELHDLELDLACKDGATRPVLLSSTSVVNADGSFLRSRTTLYDISRLKRAEERLAVNLGILQAEHELSPDGILVVDAGGRVLSCNGRFSNLWGIASGPLAAGSALGPLDHPILMAILDKLQDPTAFLALVDDLYRHRDREAHREVRLKDGRVLDTHTGPMTQANGAYIGRIWFFRDITERKRVEEQLRRENRARRALSMSNEALVRATDELALLRRICQIVIDEAGYLLCWVGYAQQDDDRTVQPMARAGLDGSCLPALTTTWADTPRGSGPTGSSIRTGRIQIAKDIAADSGSVPWRNDLLQRGCASGIAIPLIEGGKPFGALTMYAADIDAFEDEEVGLLTELANDLAYGIVSLRTQAARERAEAEEMAREREVAIGFKIQQTLLLDEPPRGIPGVRVAALTIPSQRIAGDFYQFFAHQEESLDVIVADVMGKGVPAALLGAATKSSFLEALCHLVALSPGGALPEPKQIVSRAHAGMARQLIELESFVTLCYARLDMAGKRLVLVDCGHTGVVHLPADSELCEIVRGSNLPLGIREGEIFNQVTVPFRVGDAFLFYSDGITEAFNAGGEMFGTDRLLACLRGNRKLGPDALIGAIRAAIVEFAGSDQLADDVTCVAIEIGERQPPLQRAELDILSDLKNLGEAREFVRTFCRAPPGSAVDEDWLAALELAVTEAVSNIIKHAYHGRRDQPIHMEAEAFADRVVVGLHHRGEAFDPSAVPPPAFDASRESGFGVYLLTASVDDVRYCRDDRGGNAIILTKNFKT